jgi:hypothetical protein
MLEVSINTTRGRGPLKMSPKSTNQKIYEILCELTKLPVGTAPDTVLASFTASLQARAVAAGVPADSDVPTIQAAERRARDAVKLAAALRATGGASVGHHVGGIKLLSAEEGQDVVLFGADSRLLRRRVEATELALGKTIREALEAGDLK